MRKMRFFFLLITTLILLNHWLCSAAAKALAQLGETAEDEVVHIDQDFLIKHPSDQRVPIAVSFTALINTNTGTDMTVKLLKTFDDASDEQIMRFTIGTDTDLTVDLPGIKHTKSDISKETRLAKGCYTLEVQIVLQMHSYLIKMNGTQLGVTGEFGGQFWPKEWWKEFRWDGLNAVKVQGQLKMLQEPFVKIIENENELPNDRPIVLAWSGFFSLSIFDFEHLLFGSNCSFQCLYTEDKNFENSASALLFYPAQYMNAMPDQKSRRNEQLYVLVSHESPILGSSDFENFPFSNLPDTFFNISITYRLDSTIFIPYDALTPITDQTQPQHIWTEAEIRKRLALKKRLAVQFVSNCGTHSARDELTAQLKKLLNDEFDVFGKCNVKECDEKCYQTEQESHFFYMAFENAVCTDYVTEKYWKALRNLLVPIVLCREVAEEAGIANGTFIAVDDFANAQELADHLKALRSDTDKYMSYFNWTKNFEKRRNGKGIQSALCKMCEIAHQQRDKDKLKTYNVKLDKYWNKNQCQKDFVLKMHNNN